jgi:hypothetical protein
VNTNSKQYAIATITNKTIFMRIINKKPKILLVACAIVLVASCNRQKVTSGLAAYLVKEQLGLLPTVFTVSATGYNTDTSYDGRISSIFKREGYIKKDFVKISKNIPLDKAREIMKSQVTEKGKPYFMGIVESTDDHELKFGFKDFAIDFDSIIGFSTNEGKNKLLVNFTLKIVDLSPMAINRYNICKEPIVSKMQFFKRDDDLWYPDNAKNNYRTGSSLVSEILFNSKCMISK